MKKSFWVISALTVVALFFFVSCKKYDCNELTNPCQTACEMEPMMGFCGTGAEFKYYFNKTTQQCEEYIHIGEDVPFETLEECQDCLCSRLVGNDTD